MQIGSLLEIGPIWSQIVAVVTNQGNYYKLVHNKTIINEVDLFWKIL